ncbi:MAG: YchJ family protein [Planctomycetes bacterium]|nr:YchJ family protein [Planctomycetota bacterium]
MKCPCGSTETYEACFEPRHRGAAPAETAEALMRARYCAFVMGEIDFLVDTLAPEAHEDGERDAIEAWSKGSEWHGLAIRKTDGGGPGDERGTVEFVAHFSQGGEEQFHHELATFERRNGQWRFVDGTTPTVRTKLREGPKIGRNEPCPCGSGKKYKRCCAQRSSEATETSA